MTQPNPDFVRIAKHIIECCKNHGCKFTINDLPMFFEVLRRIDQEDQEDQEMSPSAQLSNKS